MLRIFLKKSVTFLLMITLVATSFFVAPGTSVRVASAAFNPEINYQGRLLDAVGDAVADDTYNMQFKLHTALSGGSVVWTETHCYSTDSGATCTGAGTDSRVETIGGLFSVMLGSVNSLANVDFNQELYLSVNIGGVNATPSYDGEMTPRKVLGAVPAAFVADTLDGIESDQFFRNDIVNATSSATTSLAVVQNGAGKIAEFFGPSYASVLSILSTGNVGIGTTTPGAKLGVAGSGLFDGVVTASSFVATSSTATSTFAGSVKTGDIEITNGGNVGRVMAGDGTNGSTALLFQAKDDASNWYTSLQVNGFGQVAIGSNAVFDGTANATLLVKSPSSPIVQEWQNYTGDTLGVFTSTGNLGIGTSSPYAKLSVVGETVSEYFTATSTTATSTIAGNLRVNNNLQVGNSSIYIRSNATSTFDGGIDLSDGCFAVDGVCIGAGGSGANTALSNLSAVAINTSLISDTDNTDALGSASIGWSDLFLGSGAVVNFNNGDVTLTHAADALTLAGGTFILPDSGLQIGASNPFSDAAGTLTIQNIDALDATTETTVEAAIDTLSNLVSVGTIGTGIWQGTAIGDTYVADTLTISGGTINNTPIGAITPSTAVFTNATTTNLNVASGGAMNFNNGDVTLTHSSNLLTLAGGNFVVGSGDTTTIAPATISLAFSDNDSAWTTSGLSFSINVDPTDNTTGNFNIGGMYTTDSAGTIKTNISNSYLNFSGTTGSTGYGIRDNAGTVEFKNSGGSWIAPANNTLSNLASVAINTSLLPGTSDGAALGSGTKMWSDLFLANGGTINWNNGGASLRYESSVDRLLLDNADFDISGNSIHGESLSQRVWLNGSQLYFDLDSDPVDHQAAHYSVNGVALYDSSAVVKTYLINSYLNWSSTPGASGYGIRDNAGTVEFKNSGGSWTPFGSLSSSITTGDFFRFNHFENTGTTSMDPFTGAAISSGTLTTPLTTAMTTGQTPGVVRLRSAAGANSGYRLQTTAGYLLLDDNMVFEGVAQVQTSTNTTVRLGFHDSVTSADAVDGTYFEIVGTTATGKTSNNSARSSTASNYTITAGGANWYRFRIVLNSTASTVTYSIYNLSGTQLWTDTLSTNIPTAVGRETSAGIVATNSGVSAVDLVHVDYMGIGTVAGYSALTSTGSGVWTTSGSNVSYDLGSVGIGTTTPSGKFAIAQTVNTAAGGLWIAASDGDYRSIYMGTDQVLNFTGGSGNTATLNAAGAWTNASDIAYKENIEQLDYGLEEIMLLNPRRYSWKSDGTVDIGFIAQELEQVIPEVVFGADGSKTVSYGQLTSLAISGLQDIGLRIDLFDAPTSTPSLKLDADGKLIVNNDFTVQNEATFGSLNVLDTATFDQGLQVLGTSTSSFGGALLVEGSVTLGSGDITITANGVEATNAFAINESQFYVATTGAIGIGTTLPARMLHVVREGEGSPVRFQDANGYCEINPTTASLICTSDQSLKENITELTSASVLDQIRALKPVTFEWLSDEGDTARIGFIAQDVELVIPELVYTDAETGLKSVAYGGFVPYLVSAMKELVMRVDTLGTQLETLTARVEELASQSYSATIGAFQNLRVGSPQQPSGITIYDEETGAPYCLTARNGSLVTRSGECGTPINEVDQTKEQHVFEEGAEGQAVVDDGASVNDDELLDIAPTSTVPELPEGGVVEPVLPELEPEAPREPELETLPELEFDVEPEESVEPVE
jgi:hypothetical protein